MRTGHFLYLLFMFAVVSCADIGPSGPGPRVPVASVELVAPPAVISKGHVARFTAVTRSATGEQLNGRPIRWHSTRPEIAQVNDSGRVVAIELGVTTIIAVSEGRTAQAALQVVPAPEPVAQVVITSGSSVSLTRGSSRQLHAEARSATGAVLDGRQFAWSSSNPSIVTVSATGFITALAMGEAAISVSVEGRSAAIPITVLSDVVSVEMEPATLAIAVSEVRQIVALPRAEGGHVINTPITWQSHDPTVATVGSTGRVRGVRPGWTWITATALGKTGSAMVLVSSWSEFDLTNVNGSPPPATLFSLELPDTTGGTSTLRYEAVSGSLRFLDDTDRYQHAFAFRIHRDGQPTLQLTSVISGRVEFSWLTGQRVLYPANGSPPFTVDIVNHELLVRQRYFPAVAEATLRYSQLQLPGALIPHP